MAIYFSSRTSFIQDTKKNDKHNINYGGGEKYLVLLSSLLYMGNYEQHVNKVLYHNLNTPRERVLQMC
jgi:hypothetical protein